MANPRNLSDIAPNVAAVSGDISVNGVRVGRGAGSVSTNTAVGVNALLNNSTGAYNTILGYTAGAANTSGAANVVVGFQAFNANTTGSDSTAVGVNALRFNTTGSYNTALGRESLYSNTTASFSTAVGYKALYANTSAGNTAVGDECLDANTTGVNLAAFGLEALGGNTTGSNNTSLGAYSLYNNTTANNNTAVGYRAMYSNTTGGSQLAIGYDSLYSTTTANNNHAIGQQAGYSLNGGNSNLFVGLQAGYGLTTGSKNTFVGNYNPGGGTACGSAMTTGSSNTILGAYSGNQGGLDIRTSNNYIVLSDGDGNPRMWHNGSIWFLKQSGTSSVFTMSGGLATSGPFMDIGGSGTSMTVGYFATSSGYAGQITCSTTTTSYTSASDYRMKENITPMSGALEKVLALKPVTFTWKKEGNNGQGFIAHELQEICPDAVSGTKDAVDEEGKPVYQGVDTSFLVATLTAAIQELKAEFDAYKATHP